MKRIVYFILFLILAVLGIVFGVRNSQIVQFDYYLGTIETYLSFALVLALALGAGLGVFASMAMLIRAKREIARLKKSAEISAKEVTNLRTIPISDKH